MTRLLHLIIIATLFCTCSNRQRQNNVDISVSSDNKKDTSNFLYSDSGQSTFIITAGDANSSYDFQTVETNYKLNFIALSGGYSDLKHYFAKYTTISKTCTGCEGQERKIKVELHPFDNPQHIDLTIEKDCDDLTLDVHTYKTTKYGCCGAENELAIYDYQNKLIIEGDSRILFGEIPNSRIKIFAAWKNGNIDTTILGTLYFCYNSSDRYAISIKGALPPDGCSPFSPGIFIYTGNPEDKFRKDINEYSLWSLNKLEEKEKINNLTLKVAFWCDSSLNIDTISIPIINGRPFGKIDKQQFISLQQK
jgi:hypothetical protein